MKTMRTTTCVPAVAVLMSSLVLAACGVGPAPADDATAPLAGEAAAIRPEPGPTAASARTAAATPGRDPTGPTRTARPSDVAPGGACSSPADEAAPIDGGREVAQAPEPDALVPDPAPAPAPPESTGNPR